MRKPSLLAALLPLYMVVFTLLGLFIGVQIGRSSGREDLGKVQEAWRRINDRYHGQVDKAALLDGAIEGMTARLDPYCEYYTAEKYKEFESLNMKGELGGVGIVVGLDRPSGFALVETPIEGTPAFAADILPGDLIQAVDGKTLKGLTLAEIVRRIKGPPKTPVTLTMGRKGRDPFKVTLVRQIIVLEAVRSKLLPDGLGYVRISDFTEKVSGQFDSAVKDLLARGMKGLVIDLRFNGGGLLGECVTLADRFLDDGVIVTTRGRTADDVRELVASAGDTLPLLPLAVLVNESTASASEIFAGAVKDRGRGVLVGERTFGKGSVQTPFKLYDGSFLKLTTARYYTPNGTSLHREEGKKDFGLEPDYLVEMSPEEYGKLMKVWTDDRVVKGDRPPPPEGFRDLQLDAAVEVLKAKIEGREPKVEARVLPKPPEASEN